MASIWGKDHIKRQSLYLAVMYIYERVMKFYT